MPFSQEDASKWVRNYLQVVKSSHWKLLDRVDDRFASCCYHNSSISSHLSLTYFRLFLCFRLTPPRKGKIWISYNKSETWSIQTNPILSFIAIREKIKVWNHKILFLLSFNCLCCRWWFLRFRNICLTISIPDSDLTLIECHKLKINPVITEPIASID